MKALIKITAIIFALLAVPFAAAENRFEVVRQDAGGEPVRLVCVESMPEGATAETPVAVLCHGFMSNKNDPLICGIADALLARGIGVVRFDFNGHGESGGEFSRMTIANEVIDAEAVLTHCAETHPGARLALVGHSQGGVVASLTAARNGSRIAALVLAAPAAVIREDMIRGNIFGSWFDPLDPPETVAIFGGHLLVGRDYILDAQRRDVYAEAAAYRGPLFVVHGTGDRVVPWTCGERFVREHDGAPAEFRPIPGADHGFSGRIDETTKAIAGFLTAAFAANGRNNDESRGTTMNQRTERNREAMRLFEKCINTNDLELGRKLIAETAAFDTPVSPTPLYGAEGYLSVVSLMRKSFPDVQWKLVDMVADENTVAVQWECSGTFNGPAPFAGLQPNGRKFSTTVMNFYSFDEEGKIFKDVAATGIAGILQGIGAIP